MAPQTHEDTANALLDYVLSRTGAAYPKVLWRTHPLCATAFGDSHLSVGLSQSGLMHSELILTLFLRRAAPSAEFSVDRTRHLMSFLTMLGPSPDWNVGLSAEDLCTKECGWVQKVVQDLIPWDAGTDSGVSYEVGTNFIKLNVICYYPQTMAQ